MLTESDQIELDWRASQHAIGQYLQEIQSQPVALSVVLNAKTFAEVKLESLSRLLEHATPALRPRVEEEITFYKSRLDSYVSELALRGRDPQTPQDPQSASPPDTSNDISSSHVQTAPPPADAIARRKLRDHRRSILRASILRMQVENMDGLARRVGVSKSGLYGMVRENRSRYGNETLNRVLKEIGCTRHHWDNLPSAS